MAFVVEDGSSLADATAYMTVQEVRDHHTDRGIDLSATLDPAMETSIVNATDYMDKRFGRRFRGEKKQREQSLEWPRVSAYDDDDKLMSGIVLNLKRACAEYTLMVIQFDRNLAPVPAPGFGIIDPADGSVTNDSSGMITEKAEEVGPIKERTKYSDSLHKPMTGSGNLIQQIPEYPQADLWMEELIENYTSRRMVRG